MGRTRIGIRDVVGFINVEGEFVGGEPVIEAVKILIDMCI